MKTIHSGLPLPPPPSLINLTVSVDVKHHVYLLTHDPLRAQELCESRGGRAGLPLLSVLAVYVDVKPHLKKKTKAVHISPPGTAKG